MTSPKEVNAGRPWWRKFAADDTRCPLSNTAIEQARTWVLAACAAGGLGWHEAAARYGEDAAKVFPRLRRKGGDFRISSKPSTGSAMPSFR